MLSIQVGEVEDALSLESEEFEEHYGACKPSREKTDIVFHCRSGVRSLVAMEMAHRLGYFRYVIIMCSLFKN